MPSNFLFVSEPEEIFCSSEVKFYNQPVGIILAKTNELAKNAADLVKVLYEKEGCFLSILPIPLKLKNLMFLQPKQKQS
jgi:xanthine dehydrogenase molybdopterin-binding subunit B